MAERKDGIKSFFAKQQPSPAKPKGAGSGGFTQAFKEDKKPVVKEEAVPAVKEETKPDVTESKAAAADVKAVAEPKAEPVDEDDDIVLLDTAPSQSVKSESSKPLSSQRSSQDSKPEPATPIKRKRGDERGGHQTKIIRATPKEEKKGVGRHRRAELTPATVHHELLQVAAQVGLYNTVDCSLLCSLYHVRVHIT